MKLNYPASPAESVSDSLAGLSFPDPYRWLEHNSEETREWQRAQAKLASEYVREWPHFEKLKKLVRQFSTARPERGGGLPRYAGGFWFRTRGAPGAAHAQAVVSDEPMREERVIFDPASENPQRPPFLSWISPSPDGRTLALGLCTDGSESNTIRLVDVASGRVLPEPPSQPLMDIYSGGAQWLADSSGFFFTGIEGVANNLDQRVFLHRRGPAPATTLVDIPWTRAKSYRGVVVSRDGRHAVAIERLLNPIPVAVAEIGDGPLRWRPFMQTIDGTVAGYAVNGFYVAVTDVGASRGRLVAVPLDEEHPDNPDRWRELVPESDAVLRTVTPVGDYLYLSEFVDTYSRLRMVDSLGRSVAEVPLPSQGAIGEPPFPFSAACVSNAAKSHIFTFSSLTQSAGIYSHTPGQPQIHTLMAPQVTLNDAVVEDHWAVSSDGTRIPFHLVRRLDIDPSRPQPTLIWAYGGYNLPLVPQFPGAMAAFIAAGGVFVHAHIRGGAEFGLEWWRNGRLRHKQNGYNDLYAVAEHLIAAGRCSPRTLAVTGASNGGLMAGVALTQRPDLWAVVVPRVPKLDQIGHCRNPYGRNSTIEENADISDPEEVRRLATFSPYHLVRDGVAYPAVYIDAGDTDPRCPAWHARKFAARLQQASAGPAPVLVHVWENVGHGWATDKEIAILETTEWLAFTLRHLACDDRMARLA